jgi:outer membrane biosynthesis protein TonB
VGIHPAFEALILRGLAKDRARRPESALHFKRELERVLEEAGAGAGRAGAVPTTRPDAARLGMAATEAALPSSEHVPVATPRGGATKIAIIAAVGVLAVVGIVAALVGGRPPAAGPTVAGATLDASAPPPATQPAGPASARAPAAAPTGTATPSGTVLTHKAGPEPKADKPKPDKPKPDKPKPDKPKPDRKADTKGEKAVAKPDQPDQAKPDKPDVKAAAIRGLKEVLAEAEASLKAGQGKDAVTLFEEARRKNPGHPRAHRALGKLYMEKGRIGEAKQAYERYLELQPKAGDAPIMRGILDRLKK